MRILSKIIVIGVSCILFVLILISIIYKMILLFIVIMFPLVSFSIFLFMVLVCIAGSIVGSVVEEKIYENAWGDEL